MKKLLTLLLITYAAATIAQSNHSGNWTKKSYAVDGKWEILEKGDSHILMLDKDFETKKAPDLKIFLSPLPSDQLNSKNALKGSVKISELQKYEGKQEFVIPKDIPTDKFKTLLIHCEEYGVLWSVAKLN